MMSHPDNLQIQLPCKAPQTMDLLTTAYVGPLLGQMHGFCSLAGHSK